MKTYKLVSFLLSIPIIFGITGCSQSTTGVPTEIPPAITQPSAIEPTTAAPPSVEPTATTTTSEDNACETRWPQLLEVQPNSGTPGAEITIIGAEGYLDCDGLYNESSRDFLLKLDQVEIGVINCYANRCQAKIFIPEDISPGTHTFTTEGGAQITVEILDQ